MSLDVLENRLVATVGAQHVRTGPDRCADFVVSGKLPTWAVFPGNPEELAAVLTQAAEAKAIVVPWGGGTRQALGLPLRADSFLLLGLGRLDRVLEYEPADLTVSVQAGITMAALSAVLGQQGQMLPVDVPLPGRATLGGSIATAADGPRRLAYGTLRDLLIGIGVVEASGRPSKAGGRVVKNVSGFDLMKLYHGSLGTLAVIASANLKLLPRPRASRTLLAHFETRAAAFQFCDQLQASRLTPAACQLLEDTSLRLAVLAEGHPAAVQRHLRDLEIMARATDAAQIQVLEGQQQSDLWSGITEFPQMAGREEEELVVRLASLPSQQLQALQQAQQLAVSHGLTWAAQAQALGGLAVLRVRGAGVAHWHRQLIQHWPDTTVLTGPPGLSAIWGRTLAGLEVLRRIKAEFDPETRLNPGRFVVG